MPGFEPKEDEVVYLKRRLREEKARATQAEKARHEAEMRCREAEREKAVHRLLARRWQNRLNALLAAQQQQGPQDENRNDMAVDMEEDAVAAFMNGDVVGYAGLRMLLQQQQRNDNDNESEDESGSESEDEHEVEDMDHEMENDSEPDEEAQQGDVQADGFLEFVEAEEHRPETHSIAVGEAQMAPLAQSMDDSVVMEDVESAKRRAYDQPRTVSISSDDL